QDIYGLPAEAIEPGTPIHRVAEPECVGHDWECDLVEAYATIKAALARDERLLPEQRLADGRTISISAVPTENGGWVATFEDISERRAADARIAHMAHHDALTGLPNRVLFRLEAEQALKRARRG
ncbi:PAS-domain containing protein, partial [Acinetobacter baumannii]